MVNCWFGALWFGIQRVPLSNNAFHRGDSRNPNHRAPNQQVTSSWHTSQEKKHNFLTSKRFPRSSSLQRKFVPSHLPGKEISNSNHGTHHCPRIVLHQLIMCEFLPWTGAGKVGQAILGIVLFRQGDDDTWGTYPIHGGASQDLDTWVRITHI